MRTGARLIMMMTTRPGVKSGLEKSGVHPVTQPNPIHHPSNIAPQIHKLSIRMYYKRFLKTPFEFPNYHNEPCGCFLDVQACLKFITLRPLCGFSIIHVETQTMTRTDVTLTCENKGN